MNRIQRCLVAVAWVGLFACGPERADDTEHAEELGASAGGMSAVAPPWDGQENAQDHQRRGQATRGGQAGAAMDAANAESTIAPPPQAGDMHQTMDTSTTEDTEDDRTSRPSEEGGTMADDMTRTAGGTVDETAPNAPTGGIALDMDPPDDPLRGGSEATPPDNAHEAPPEPVFAPAPPGMYRLTQQQYRNLIADVFGEDIPVPDDLEPDTPIHGFASIGAGELSISARAVEQYEAAALSILEAFLASAERRATYFPCADPVADGQCLRAGIAAMGLKLWRRPLANADIEDVVALVEALAPTLRDPWLTLRHALSVLLQSPHFLFRIEVGEVDPTDASQRRYTGLEMASRLAFLFWNRGPDDALLADAEQGRLTSDDGLRTVAARLADDPRTTEAILDFFAEYLNLERLDHLEKDRTVFALMSDTLGPAMRTEIELLIDRVVNIENEDIRSLLTTRRTFINDELAAVYQVNAPEAWRAYAFPLNSPRAGLLTTAGVLAMNAHHEATSPTYRGKYVQNKIRCFDIPPPPPGVVAALNPDEVGNAPRTIRQKLAQHREDPACAGCHLLMDPIGLSFENFDALGMWRTTEHGLPIDASGEYAGERFNGPKRLGELLAQSEDFGHCVVRQLFRYGMAHLETVGEEPAIMDLQDQFADAGFRFKTLLTDLALSPAFRRPGELQ
ncbi:MAG: DUF1592 domain-containing protein [Myxococcota bacterium]|nr:DUF1592 domain-containing protein [Myxococcota bacterium]